MNTSWTPLCTRKRFEHTHVYRKKKEEEEKEEEEEEMVTHYDTTM